MVRAASCDAPEVVTLIDGMTIPRSFDLRTAPHGVTTGCPGNNDTGQVVYELIVPGSGPHAIIANTGVVGTDRSLDTVLAMRRSACAGPVSDACWDDYAQDRRARADFLAQGGDHVYLILSAYSSASEGPTTLSLTSRTNAPPTIDTANALLAGDQLLVDVSGGDPDGNGYGVTVRLHGPAGELIDIDGDGMRTSADVLEGPFARSVSGATTFIERTRIALTAAQIPRVGGATSAFVRILDEPRSISVVDVRTPVLGGSIALLGEACDATHVCSEENSCAGGTHTCQPSPARASACASAMPLTIPTPTTMTTSTSSMGVLMQGTGLFEGDCASTLGLEDIYTVTVPDMVALDLVLTTENPGSDPMGDTVIYVRSQCAEPAATMMDWCNDDDDPTATSGAYLSRLVIEDIAAGDYSVFVEAYQGVQPDMTLRYELSAALRPVLPTGSACDPTEVRDRCSSATCDPTSRTCP